MLQKHLLVQKRLERIVPSEIQRHKMGDKITILRHACPRMRRDLQRRLIAQVMDIHNLPTKRRGRPLDIDQIAHILQFTDRLGGRLIHRTEVHEGVVDVRANLLRRCIAANEIKQPERLRLVGFTDELEEVIEQISMVSQLISGALGGDAAALVERFIEDARPPESAAVVAGRHTGTLALGLFTGQARGRDSFLPG